MTEVIGLSAHTLSSTPARWTAALLAVGVALILAQHPWQGATAAAPGVEVAYVATGGNFPDALAGSTLASLTGAPLLLVNKNSIPADTRTELERLAPGSIVVFGGTGVVSDAVVAELEDLTAGAVTRIAGANRFATAAEISKALPSLPPDPVVTSGGAAYDGAVVTTSTDWVDVDTAEITIPEGAEFLIAVSVSAETACVRTDGNPPNSNYWCAARVLLDGEELHPQGHVTRGTAIDHAAEDEEWRSHALLRHSDGLVGEGTHTLTLQVAVNRTNMSMRVDDWVMLVEALPQ